MKRYDILDGFRGYFLMFMLVNHFAFQGGSLLARFNHAELGYVQDAQGFIFISGLIVGLYYAGLFLKGQPRDMDRKILLRTWTLFQYSLALIAVIAMFALLFPATEAAWGDLLAELYRSPLTVVAGMVTLLYQPTYLDILPQYILYLLASPLLIPNILKCRPDTAPGVFGNRAPTPTEMQTCRPFLVEQIEVIQPSVLVALGAVAVEGLLGMRGTMRELRGRWHTYNGIPLMITYHPAYLLRNQAPSEKRKVWEDMLRVLERLEQPISERQRNYFL